MFCVKAVNAGDEMLRVAVCDDEAHVLNALSGAIEAAFARAELSAAVERFAGTGELWSAWSARPFDVLFLDIDMPQMDGISFGQLIRAHNLTPCIVYVSNREERVFETFAVSPLRFVRKSHFAEEIDDAVRAVVRWWAQNRQRKLVVTSRGSIVSLEVDDIVDVECFAKVQNIVMAGTAHEVKCTLAELEGKLAPFGFLRPHKGYLVNHRYVSCIEAGDLVLRNGTKIPISKYKMTEVKQQFLRLTTQALSIQAGKSPPQ